MDLAFEAFSTVCLYYMMVSLSFETKCSLNISQAALNALNSWNSRSIIYVKSPTITSAWICADVFFVMNGSQWSVW